MIHSTDAPQDFQSRLRRLEDLLMKVERFADPAAQSHTRELVKSILDLHGTGLQRVLEHLDASGEPGRSIIQACADDKVISGLLLLHGLHPVDLETRVRQALDSVRPYLRSHGGNVELLEIRDGIVRLRLEGSCHGCPSSAMTLKQTIDTAICEKAPDAAGIEVEEETQLQSSVVETSRLSLPILAG